MIDASYSSVHGLSNYQSQYLVAAVLPNTANSAEFGVATTAAHADSDNNGSEMTSRANVPSFSAEDNANARVWFDNLLKYKDSMKWSDEKTNCVGQLALVGKASNWVEYLTLNDSGSLATLDEFKKAFLERFDKTQSVLEAQHLISNLRQSSDEDVQDFFERVSTCCLLYTSPSPRDRQKSRMPSSA